MRISGNTSHCEEDVLAGQRKAPSGNEGARTMVSDRGRVVSLTGEEAVGALPPAAGFLPLRRGLCGDEVGVAMLEAATCGIEVVAAASEARRSGDCVLSCQIDPY